MSKKAFYCWMDDGCCDPEDWEKVEAHDSSEAAEIFAERCHDDSAGESFPPNEEQIVFVKKPTDDVVKFTVTMELSPNFYVDLVE